MRLKEQQMKRAVQRKATKAPTITREELIAKLNAIGTITVDGKGLHADTKAGKQLLATTRSIVTKRKATQ